MGASRIGALARCLVGRPGPYDGRGESQGQWADHLRQVIISMFPKPKAETDAGVRHIKLLPYIYRV